jgi:hypothetical protein
LNKAQLDFAIDPYRPEIGYSDDAGLFEALGNPICNLAAAAFGVKPAKQCPYCDRVGFFSAPQPFGLVA